MVITIAKLYSTNSGLRFYAGSNPALSVSEICDGENIQRCSQWSCLKVRRKHNVRRKRKVRRKRYSSVNYSTKTNHYMKFFILDIKFRFVFWKIK